MTQADVEALSRSFRSRVALLVLLVLTGLGAALWSSTRKSGIGAPEDRRQIMVVTAGSDINYYAVLERAGFEVEVDDLDDWLREARVAVAKSEAEGVALVLELADLRGFGFVVFERPSELDFAGLELEPVIADVDRLAERDYVVASVGDFAFPHRLSFDDPDDDPHMRLPGYGALQAVFRQELINAREDADRPTVEELQFEDAVSLGRQMFERPAEFDAVIEGTRAAVDAALDDGSGAKTLVPPPTTGTAIPTPDGGILLFHHELVIYSDNARTLELEAGAQMQLSWIGPDALAAGLETGEFERGPCPSLAGGILSMAELPRIEAAVDGSAVAIGSPEGGTIVWRKIGPGCDWAPVAELDGGAAMVVAPSLAGAAVAARAEHDDERGRVLVWALPDDANGESGQGDRLEAQALLEQTGRRFGSLAFLDERHIVVASEVREAGMPSERERVYLLDRTRPGLYLSLALELVPELRAIRRVHPLAPASDSAGPELLFEALSARKVELIRVRIGADAWAAFGDAAAAESELGVEGRLVSLTSEQLEFESVTEAGIRAVASPSVAGGSLIYVSRDGSPDSELTLVELGSRASRRLTDNDLRDYLPRLADDGSFTTFVSLVHVDISTTPFSVPRVLQLK